MQAQRPGPRPWPFNARIVCVGLLHGMRTPCPWPNGEGPLLLSPFFSITFTSRWWMACNGLGYAIQSSCAGMLTATKLLQDATIRGICHVLHLCAGLLTSSIRAAVARCPLLRWAMQLIPPCTLRPYNRFNRQLAQGTNRIARYYCENDNTSLNGPVVGFRLGLPPSHPSHFPHNPRGAAVPVPVPPS